MRETEFRAWDVEEKCWIPSELIALTYDGKLITCDDVYSPWVNEVIPVDVTFYTGLSDKNGNKIFEGDIIQFQRAGYLNRPKFVVDFKDGSFYLQSKHPGYDSDYIHDYNLSEHCEVIGNVYENPDLIK